RARLLRLLSLRRDPVVARGVRDRGDHRVDVARAALDSLPVGSGRPGGALPADRRRHLAGAHRPGGALRHGGISLVSPVAIGILVLVATLAVLATGLPIAFGLGA